MHFIVVLVVVLINPSEVLTYRFNEAYANKGHCEAHAKLHLKDLEEETALRGMWGNDSSPKVLKIRTFCKEVKGFRDAVHDKR